jgi:glycolate oxidase subunit GlcD
MKKIDSFLAQVATFLRPQQIATDSESLTYYAQDWSKSLTPNASAILFPESTAEVSQILKLASAHALPIVPSGGRTGLSGGAVATQGEIVLSLTRMNQIGALHESALTLRVEAGVITEAVHQHCAPYGLTWPVDFASKGSSTVGGNIATNAGGVRVIRYGNTRNWVLGTTVVTMDGTIHHYNSELEKNNTGYDLRHLISGSEGTLGIITEATLKLCPLPKQTLVILFSLKDFPSLLRLFNFARSTFPHLSAFECLDSASMESVRNHFSMPLPVTTPGSVYALMEIENTPFSEAESGLSRIMDDGIALDAVLAQNDQEAKTLWHYREGVAESILHEHQVHQEDVSVPVSKLEAFYSEIESRYAKELPGFQVFFFGHIGDGNLHIFIRRPKGLSTEKFIEKTHESDHALFQILQKLNGSVSAEHGIGILKKHALHFSRSEAEQSLMRGVKRVFDPKGLLNPGKIFD